MVDWVLKHAKETAPVLFNTISYAIKTPTLETVPLYQQNMRVDTTHQGYLGIALATAFHELVSGRSFEKMLVSIMSRGGDTDTNCAITGALYGAIKGYQCIPVHLCNQIITRHYPRVKVYPWGKRMI